MIHLIRILTLLLSIVYNVVLFQCAQTLFVQKLDWKKNYLYTSLINIPLFAIFHIFPLHMFWAMIVFFVVIMLEIQLLFKEHWKRSLFGTFCFAVNFFSLHLLFSSIYSLVKSVPIYYPLLDEKALLLTTIFTLLTLIPYIAIFRRYFPYHIVNMISSDETVLFFANSIIGAIYIYIMVNTFTMDNDTHGFLIQKLHIVNSVFALIGFTSSLIYAYVYSKLILFKTRSNEIETILEESQQEYDNILVTANYDLLTHCYTRDLGLSTLENALQSKNVFCVIYFDIDGLKFTNDTFDHAEGDWYIQQVANVLQNVFKSHFVCRLSGDEFLAILENHDAYFGMLFAVRTFEAVEALSALYKKPYPTSVSYGVISYKNEKNLSVEKIIDIADKRMYEFKKSRRKHR